ncbi:MAG: hypothetical protein ACKV19_14035 [Verrucomicrobiales bacterium]
MRRVHRMPQQERRAGLLIVRPGRVVDGIVKNRRQQQRLPRLSLRLLFIHAEQADRANG